MRTLHRLLLLPLFLFLAAAGQPAQPPPAQEGGRAEVVLRREGAPTWALAIHGGAGTIPKSISEAERDAYLKSLSQALAAGRDLLAAGGTSLDAVEKVVRV